MALFTANATLKHSNFSGCKSGTAGPVHMFHSTLTIDTVVIKNSHQVTYAFNDCRLEVFHGSYLFARHLVMTGCESIGIHAGIVCKETSHVYLESVLFSSHSSTIYSKVLASFSCNITMDNITIVNIKDAIEVEASNILIYNSFVCNNTGYILKADSSNLTFWNLKLGGPGNFLG